MSSTWRRKEACNIDTEKGSQREIDSQWECEVTLEVFNTDVEQVLNFVSLPGAAESERKGVKFESHRFSQSKNHLYSYENTTV